MAYRTKLVLESGDRVALEATVEALVDIADRQGAEVTGPHSKPAREVTVPLYKRPGGERFRIWRYRVYRRTLEVTGPDRVMRALAAHGVPDSIDLTLSIDTVGPLGSSG